MSETPKLQSNTDFEDDVLEQESKKKWYVFYTAPRAEKVIQQELDFRGYEVLSSHHKNIACLEKSPKENG